MLANEHAGLLACHTWFQNTKAGPTEDQLVLTGRI